MNFDWSSCIICQVKSSAKEKLECPADLKRKDYNPLKTYENIAKNINRFRELDAIPVDNFILPENQCTQDIFLKMKAKFHKLCRNKFSDMKLERLEEKITTLEQAHSVSDTVLNVDCEMTDMTCEEGNTIRSSARISSFRKIVPENENLNCLFCGEEKKQRLRRAATFKLDKKVRQYAIIL